MATSTMKTDLIVAWHVREWLRQHAPHLLNRWTLVPGEEIGALAAKMQATFPHIADVLVSQVALAKIIVEVLDLQNVALLGAGMPTPLSPDRVRVKYYTDPDPEVVREGQLWGYYALPLDARKSEDVRQLKGATTAVAAGVFHFLEDDEFPSALKNLAMAGIHTLVFNHLDSSEAGQVAVAYQFGAQLYPRTVNEVRALLPSQWGVAHVYRMAEMVEQSALGQHLRGLPNLYNVFWLERS